VKIVGHRVDLQVEHEYFAFASGENDTVRSKSIQVGDIMRVQKDEVFPVDLILIVTSNPDGSKFQLLLSITKFDRFEGMFEAKIGFDEAVNGLGDHQLCLREEARSTTPNCPSLFTENDAQISFLEYDAKRTEGKGFKARR
jgi:hypothetical protein